MVAISTVPFTALTTVNVRTAAEPTSRKSDRRRSQRGRLGRARAASLDRSERSAERHR